MVRLNFQRHQFRRCSRSLERKKTNRDIENISHTTLIWECCQSCLTLIGGFNRQKFGVMCCRYLEGALALVDRLPLRSAVSSWVPHPRADPRTGTEVREQQRATAERALTITLKGRFWVAVAAICSPSFHLSISFSALVLSSVSPGPGWRYSDWYTVDSRQLIPDSVSAIQSCSSCFFTPSPKGY